MKISENSIVGTIGPESILTGNTIIGIDAAKAEQLKKRLKFPVAIVASFEEFLMQKPTVIVEAASQQAAKAYAPAVVAQGIELIVMSTGALLDMDIDMTRVHVPSGAIGGLDALSAAALAGIDEVTLTTRKPPKALGKANSAPECVYEGTAEEAARKFPREMNVAATLALTVKPTKVHVQVISDPAVTRNTHEIQAKWRYGTMHLQFANVPHPDNPHTSALAAWAAIKLLQVLLYHKCS